MPYNLYKTNGLKFVTIDDASLNNTTNLTFVGKNYAGYGEIVNENFLKLLENFSNTEEPNKPILGQLWFDSSTKRLSVYDGKKFKGISHIQIKSGIPDSPVEGELWWDTSTKQLKAYNGTEYKLIGPLSSAARSSWDFTEELQQGDLSNTSVPVIKAKIGTNNIAVISKNNFTPRSTSDLTTIGNANESFEVIKKGITLVGSDGITGSSKDAGVYFWGTAAESLIATTSTNLISLNSTANTDYSLTFVTTGNPGNDSAVFVNSGLTYNPSTQVLNTVVTSARYADLAERYFADSIYEPGTVVVIGGDREITVTKSHADVSVIGVISTNPAYIMNSESGNDEYHPCVALRGRVPCKVVGKIKKGDLLVSSSIPGYAEIMKSTDNPLAVIGKALESFEGPKGLIEIVV